MRYALILLLLLLATSAAGANLDFTLHKLDSGRPGPTILVVGGVQGDEPGGFSAAALLISHYRITSGAVWVVPNLNFLSIIRCSRGVYGDMNRKFADLDPGDPEYAAVQNIKHIITDPRVDAVLHLHDGWGFYSPTTVSDWQCPQRWGQSVIIDQDTLDAKRFGNLGELAATAAAAANEHLYDPIHAYHVKNTHTRELENENRQGDVQDPDVFRPRQPEAGLRRRGQQELAPGHAHLLPPARHRILSPLLRRDLRADL